MTIRRHLLIGAGSGCAVVIAIGLLVWSSQQGYLGPDGRAKHLLAVAERAYHQERLPDAQAGLEELIATFPDSPWTAKAMLLLGQVFEAQDLRTDARTMYRLLLKKFPASALVTKTQEHLGRVNIALIFSPTVRELDAIHEVKPGDTLGEIASANNTTVQFIKRANGLTSDTIYPRQRLKVPQGRFKIIVDKSQNHLLLTEEDEFVKAYTVATGKDNSTPEGMFTVVNKIVDPVWYTQGAVVPSDSPENILGTRWMGISEKGYGIHGSVDPEALGHQVTAGCVRMSNAEVEELFDIISIGTEVTIVD